MATDFIDQQWKIENMKINLEIRGIMVIWEIGISLSKFLIDDFYTG